MQDDIPPAEGMAPDVPHRTLAALLTASLSGSLSEAVSVLMERH